VHPRQTTHVVAQRSLLYVCLVPAFHQTSDVTLRS